MTMRLMLDKFDLKPEHMAEDGDPTLDLASINFAAFIPEVQRAIIERDGAFYYDGKEVKPIDPPRTAR